MDRYNLDGKLLWVIGSNLLVRSRIDGGKEGILVKVCRSSSYRFIKGEYKSVYDFIFRK